MPEYSRTDINELISKQEAELMVAECELLRDKALLSLLWLIPARPSELMELKRKDFRLNYEGNVKSITMKITTKKLRKGKFQPKRNFNLIHHGSILTKSIWGYLRYLKDEEFLFPISRRMIAYIVDKAGMKSLNRHLCAYAFRHSAMTRFANKGYGIEQLMHLKGSADIKSISPYLHGKDQEIDVE